MDSSRGQPAYNNPAYPRQLDVKALIKTYTIHFALDDKMRVKAEELFIEYIYKRNKCTVSCDPANFIDAAALCR